VGENIKHSGGNDHCLDCQTIIDLATESFCCFEFDTPIPNDLPIDKQVEQICQASRLTRINQSLLAMFDYVSAQRIEGTNLERIFIFGDLKARLVEFVQNDYRLEDTEISELFNSSELRTFLIRLVGVIEDDQLVRIWCSLRDTQDNNSFQNDNFIQNVLYDELTELPNRALMLDRLQYNLEMTSANDDYSFALLMIDLDRFKVVNEGLGFTSGDVLVKRVAQRIKAIVKDGDTVSRIGGDEFVVILSNVRSPENATRIADRIQKALVPAFILREQEVFITAGIGIVFCEDAKIDSGTIIQNAESAMYKAKKMGKGSYSVFDRAMNERAIEQLQLETDLRMAVKSQDIGVYYQPIVAVNGGSIVGFEALARWQHPFRGFISPAVFIPLAEETGLIETVGEMIFVQTCQQLKAWHQAGHQNLQASVNLTGLQFRMSDLPDKINNLFDEIVGLEHRTLKFEITETVASQDAEFAILTMQRLKEMGFQLSIDDFGTGLSSLSYLKRFPIDTLKIDRSFIQDIFTDQGSLAIVTTVILLAHALGFEIIAEGVETKEQLEFLKRHNCDYIQGTLVSEPVPASRFEQILNKKIPIV
jgi:diguanylate cyclase (GGDEF)-like protein